MDTMSELLGMGITIQLRNMFSGPARAVVASSRGLTDSIMADTERVNNGWKLIGSGAAMMFIGTGMLSFLGAVGKASVKSSSDLEIFRRQMGLLAKDATVGDNLFNQLTTFATKTPFTIPQVMAGARNLMAFGLSANKVVEQLKLAGDWASMFSVPIDEAAMIIGKVKAGSISYAMKSLQRMGVSYKDILDAGGPIDPKSMRTLRGADPEKFLTALNKVLEEKFGGGMSIMMSTIPGMLTNMKDQFILMGKSIGDALKPQIKDILHSMLIIFNPDIVLPFAKAVGDGLGFVLRIATMLLKPIGEFTVWLMRFTGQHPGVMKLVISMIALTGTLLNVGGALLILLGIWQVASFVLASASTATLFASLGAAIPIVLALAAASAIFYDMWEHNFGGVQTTIMRFWNTAKMIGGALVELLSNFHNGVGNMSQFTAAALKNSGLFGIVVQLFMVGYRVYAFVSGVVDGIGAFVDILAFFAGNIVSAILIPLQRLGTVLLDIGKFFGWANVAANLSSNTWHGFGVVAGGLISIFVALRVATMLYTVGLAIGQGVLIAYNAVLFIGRGVMLAWSLAIKAVTVAQWALNLAMDANPIGLIIIGIAVVIGLYAAIIRYHTQISAWLERLPTWARVMITMFMPIQMLVLDLANNWTRIKGVFVSTAEVFQMVWTKVIDWVTDKFDALLSKFHMIGTIAKEFWNIGLPSGSSFAIDMPHTNTPSRMTQTQMNQLSGFAAQQRQLDRDRSVDQRLSVMEANTQRLATQPHQPIVLKLDGKTVATVVHKHVLANATAGRD